MENREQMIEAFTKEYGGLTDEQKKAVYWLIRNIGLAEELSKGERISKNEMKNLIEKARSKKDYIMLVLLLYKRQIDGNSDS